MIRAVKEPESLLRLGLLALGLGAALLGVRTVRGRLAVVVGALSAVVAVLVMDRVLGSPSGLASAEDGIGRATYLGLSLPTNIRAVEAMYAAAIVIALGAFILWRLWNRGANVATGDTVPERPPANRVSWLIAGIAAVAAISLLIPDLRVVVKEATEGQYPSGWDSENLVAWSEFAARGLVPMKDFWYPYGNFSVFESGLVKGEIASALYRLSLFAAYWWIFWIAAQRRLVASSLAALGLLAAEPIIGEFFRYGLALAIALAYTGIHPLGPPRLNRAARIVLGRWSRLGCSSTRSSSATPPSESALYSLSTSFGDGGLDPVVGTAACCRLALPLGGLVAISALAALRGQLNNLVELYTTLEESSAYSAFPTTLLFGLRSALDVSVLMVWLPPVLLGVGLVGRLTTPGSFLGSRASEPLSRGRSGRVALDPEACSPCHTDPAPALPSDSCDSRSALVERSTRRMGDDRHPCGRRGVCCSRIPRAGASLGRRQEPSLDSRRRCGSAPVRPI